MTDKIVTTSTATNRSLVVSAGIWVFSGHALAQLIRLAGNLVMTRLLVPEMFGVLAIANVIIMGFALISDIGLQQNIVQSKNGRQLKFLNVVWTIQVVRGFALWILIILCIPIIQAMTAAGLVEPNSVFRSEELYYVVAALSVTVIISGFNSTKLATANRRLQMGPVVKLELISQVCALAIMIIWALLYRSVWALVIGSIVGSMLKLVLSHVYLPGERNKLSWDWKVFKEVFNFGKWILLSSLFGFLAMSGDRLILGGLADAATMGQISIAMILVAAIRDTVNKVLGSVAFPALAEVARSEPDKIKSTYYRFRLPTDAALLFLSGFLFYFGHVIVDLLFDERYRPAGPILEILSLSLMQVRYGLSGQCYMALGAPKVIAQITIIRAVGVVIFIPAAFSRFGLEGAIWAMSLAAFFSFPVTLWFKFKYKIFSLKRELLVLPFFLIGCLLAILLLASSRNVFSLT